MHTPQTHWKNEIADLRVRADAVKDGESDARLSPRAAARCLSGVIHHVSTRWGVDVMQQACAELARHEATWRTAMGLVLRPKLPLSSDARVSWASESDPAEWQRVLAA